MSSAASRTNPWYFSLTRAGWRIAWISIRPAFSSHLSVPGRAPIFRAGMPPSPGIDSNASRASSVSWMPSTGALPTRETIASLLRPDPGGSVEAIIAPGGVT
jgi:hypothetical protein